MVGGVIDEWSIARASVNERERERGLVGRGVTEEFCVKVLKFEIINSQKSFNYFSGVLP